ncbi:hypothetical protein, partial [Pseudomonas aeruginosa]|uniref:hypothetical protein n=1 Tax=Pseudomonas aeruginosa TaxID=287 RepID=UPI0022B744CC
NRKSSSDSWDGGLVEGSWTEGYFSTGQMACADLIGESTGVEWNSSCGLAGRICLLFFQWGL